jgi:hypothetical protein
MPKFTIKEIKTMFRSGPTEDKLDKTPVEMPLGARHPTPLNEIIARMVRQAVAEEEGKEPESYEEANDFEPDETDLPDFSPYTLTPIIEDYPEGEAPASLDPQPDTSGQPGSPEPTTVDPPDPNAVETSEATPSS